MIWVYSIGSVLLVSLISLVGLFTLSLSEGRLKRVIFVLVSLSVGALFGDVFIHLLPEAFESGASGLSVSLSVLGGIFFFFILEKFLLWRHSHGADEEGAEGIHHDHSRKPLATVVLVADGIHNFIDGVVIAFGFLVSAEAGVATAIAVILHEIPQEIGDFGLLIHAGYSRLRALLWNFLSALLAVAGAVLTLLVGPSVESLIPFAIALAAGGFIYIAGSDLVPELQKNRQFKTSVIQILSIFIGVLAMLVLVFFE